MEEKKLCPLLAAGMYASGKCSDTVLHECRGNDCVLWNKTGHCCTFASMAWSLRQLIAAVNEQKGG